jgi:hypothetical protein
LTPPTTAASKAGSSAKARAAANGRVDSDDLTLVLTLLGIPREDWHEA